MMLILDSNLQAKAATTQFMGISVNSMVKFGDGFLVANESGLFSLGGDQDDGTDITAFFELNHLDFWTHRQKRVRFFYIGFKATGALTMTVSTDIGKSAVIPIPYHRAGQAEVRVPCPRTVYGTYWTIRIGNVGGYDFSIDYIKALPLVR